jgi:hypothetical protein
MTDLPRAVETLIDAANVHDTDRFLACFAPDGLVDDWGREFRGAGAMIALTARVTATPMNSRSLHGAPA